MTGCEHGHDMCVICDGRKSSGLMTKMLAFDPLTVTGKPGAFVAAGYIGSRPFSADGATFEEACVALLEQVEASLPGVLA